MSWQLTGNNVIHVRSYYTALYWSNGASFPWKTIWRVKAPIRVSFFVLTVAWGRILTHDNLIRKGFSLVGWCCMCHCNGETVAHLLLHCETTFGLWSRALGFFGIQWVLPGMVTDLLLGWWKWLGKHSSDILEPDSAMSNVAVVEGAQLSYFQRYGALSR